MRWCFESDLDSLGTLQHLILLKSLGETKGFCPISTAPYLLFEDMVCHSLEVMILSYALTFYLFDFLILCLHCNFVFPSWSLCLGHQILRIYSWPSDLAVVQVGNHGNFAVGAEESMVVLQSRVANLKVQ